MYKFCSNVFISYLSPRFFDNVLRCTIYSTLVSHLICFNYFYNLHLHINFIFSSTEWMWLLPEVLLILFQKMSLLLSSATENEMWKDYFKNLISIMRSSLNNNGTLVKWSRPSEMSFNVLQTIYCSLSRIIIKFMIDPLSSMITFLYIHIFMVYCEGKTDLINMVNITEKFTVS